MDNTADIFNLNSLGAIAAALVVVVVLVSVSSKQGVSGQELDSIPAYIGNPAAIYCQTVMGYGSYVVTDEMTGSQTGYCRMPNGTSCGEWDFYAGKCGSQYSYCARNGYATVTKTDGNDNFSPHYSVCVSDEGVSLGSVTDLVILPEIVAAVGR
ncbi:DUF333 domain-containing protein [Patescibacteria group bacterium]|nr:DUF333 domain-containing protein [Patescibacteria group bacterium]